MHVSVCTMSIAMLAGAVYAQQDLNPTPTYEAGAGFVSANDGTFNYQGYLEVDGDPANGMYSFRFEAFDDPIGPNIASELFFVSPLVPVVDGLFQIDVQMGGDAMGGKQFWRTVGDLEMYLEIGVSTVEGGPYTTLGTRSKLGWSARAQYAGISESLRFPYTDVFTDPEGGAATMMSLTSTFGGIVLQTISELNANEAIIDVQSATPSGFDFGFQTGGVHIDAEGRSVGLLTIADEFPLASVILSDSGFQQASIVAQVNSGASGADAIEALNFDAGTSAYLATPSYAGEFEGDVTVNGDIKRTYSGTEASAAPIAYGSVFTSGTIGSGTGNFSVVWDATLSRYEIAIENEFFVFSQYTAVVTPAAGGNPRLVSTSSVSGNLLVYILDPLDSYARVQSGFQFAVYKADPNLTVINRNNTSMDDDEFYRANGLTPEIIRTGEPTPPKRERKGITVGN